MTPHEWKAHGPPEAELENDNVSRWGTSQAWRCARCRTERRVTRAGEDAPGEPTRADLEIAGVPEDCDEATVEGVHAE